MSDEKKNTSSDAREGKQANVNEGQGECLYCGARYAWHRNPLNGSSAFVSLAGEADSLAREATAIASGVGSAAAMNGSAKAGDVIVYRKRNITVPDQDISHSRFWLGMLLGAILGGSIVLAVKK